MNIRSFFCVIACIICVAGAQRASASEVLYDASGFLQGQQSFVQSFNITGPGTLTVSLGNVDWPEQLASLDMVLSSGSGDLLGPEMGAGTESFHIGSGLLFAQWFGTAQGPLDAGVYSLKVEFQPSVVSAVPLPTSIALLLSGIALLVWQRRDRVSATPHSI
jgi:hypothetical protein